MAFASYFYHESIKKYIVAFGSLFNGIQVHRTDAAGLVVKTITVPLAYGPAHKYFLKWDGTNPRNNDGTKPKVKMTLPRIGFEIEALQFDGSRMLTKDSQIAFDNPDGSSSIIQQGVPWTFNFSLKIMAKNIDDGLQIIEQIIPAFNPSYSVSVIEIPEMGVKKDVIISLQDIQQQDDYEGTFDNERLIMWSLSFSLKGRIYPPVRTANRIQSVISDVSLLPLNNLLETINVSMVDVGGVPTVQTTIV